MIREDNQVLGKSVIYKYDQSGNILWKEMFDYTTESLSEGLGTKILYSYNMLGQMNSYDNKRCVYDKLGNAIIYCGEEAT